MTVRITGGERLQRRLRQVRRAIRSQHLFAEVALFQMLQIKKRTIEGKDYQGNKFKPYSDRYAKFRRDRGRPTSKVDLTFTGAMLNSMTYDADAGRARLFFQNTTDENNVRNPLKAFYNHRRRKFFEVSSEDQRQIADIIRRYIREAANG